jgi:hypothetical protein
MRVGGGEFKSPLRHEQMFDRIERLPQVIGLEFLLFGLGVWFERSGSKSGAVAADVGSDPLARWRVPLARSTSRRPIECGDLSAVSVVGRSELSESGRAPLGGGSIGK